MFALLLCVLHTLFYIPLVLIYQIGIILGLIVSDSTSQLPPTLTLVATMCNSLIVIDYEPDHYIYASYGPDHAVGRL